MKRSGRPSFLQLAALVVLGLFLGLATLEVGLRVGGVLWLRAQAQRNLASMESGGEHRILCIGESTTAFGGETSYPRLLEAHLNDRAGRPAFSVINEGVPRTTTEAILERLPQLLDEHQPEAVVAMIGINDRKYLFLSADDSSVPGWVRRLQVVKLASLLLEHLGERWSGEEGPMDDGGAPALTFEEARRAVESDPTDIAAHRAAHAARGAGRRQETFSAGERALQEAIRRDPSDPTVRNSLAELYLLWGRTPRAQAVLDEAYADGVVDAETSPLLLRTMRIRMTGALVRGRLDEAEGFARTLLVRIPPEAEESRADVLATLGSIARRRGDRAAAEEYARQARTIRAGRVSQTTEANYRAIASLLASRGVSLVAVQYPMRSLEPLRSLLKGERVAAFVDNEERFQRAVDERGYTAIFTDSFAGDFGHMSRAGRDLLAASVAEVVLRDLHPEMDLQPERDPRDDASDRPDSGSDQKRSDVGA